jgi:FixJ family two-component response regulator
MKQKDGIIIVVDDEAIVGKLVAEYLQTLKFQVVVFADPRQAFDFIASVKEEVALLVTDYDMPVINGAELAKEVKRLIQQIKTVCVTGNGDISESVEFDGFLRKPFLFSQLKEVVEEVLLKN